MNLSTKLEDNEEEVTKTYTLHDMRVITGKSGSAVARLCQVSYHSLRNWETGKTVPNIVNISDLLEIYGYTFYQLDLTPYYEKINDRVEKKRQLDRETDNPNRESRQLIFNTNCHA